MHWVYKTGLRDNAPSQRQHRIPANAVFAIYKTRGGGPLLWDDTDVEGKKRTTSG